MPKASVIITTYQRANFFLSRAIESVLTQQTDFKFEILVMDDNGVNSEGQLETQLILQPYIAANKIVYIPLSKNSGACLARNKGIALAKGKYIFFLDDDDEFLPQKLQVQISVLENNSIIDGSLAAFKRMGEDNLEIKAASNFPIVGDFKNFAIRGNFFTPMLCIKKEALMRIGGFHSIERFQDRYMMLHALSEKMKFKCIGDPLHIMYEHSGDRITNISITKTITSLNIIKNFIHRYKVEFVTQEWNQFLVNDLRMRGTLFYVAAKYTDRIKAVPFFLKAFQTLKQADDLKSAFKAILKV